MYTDRWDIYEREKEELTTANIIRDLREYYRGHIVALFFAIILIPLVYLCVKIVNKLFSLNLFGYDFVKIFTGILFFIFFIVMLILIIKETRNIITGFSAMKKRNFQIFTDMVIKKIPMSLDGSRTTKLIFEHNGTYTIHLDTPYYKWSLFYHLTGEYIFERTSLKDEFYLISIGKQKNIIAYNRKHFEFKE